MGDVEHNVSAKNVAVGDIGDGVEPCDGLNKLLCDV